MLNYTWRLSSLKALTRLNDDGKSPIASDDILSPITAVYWRLQATDGEKFAEVTGIQEFDKNDITEENFTKFSDLTKNDIIGWVQRDLGEEAIETMKQDLANQLN